jgi:hypothetical protein
VASVARASWERVSWAEARRGIEAAEDLAWVTAYIEKLRGGEAVSFRPRGNSMAGRIESGQLCTVEPVVTATLRIGDNLRALHQGRRLGRYPPRARADPARRKTPEAPMPLPRLRTLMIAVAVAGLLVWGAMMGTRSYVYYSRARIYGAFMSRVSNYWALGICRAKPQSRMALPK